MDSYNLIFCDDGCTQPFGYVKQNGRYYFTIASIEGFGKCGEPKIIDGYEFDMIRPCKDFGMSGHIAIGVRNGRNWGVWRYSSFVNKSSTLPQPVDQELLLTRVVEIVPDIQETSFDKAIAKYKEKYASDIKEAQEEAQRQWHR